MADPFRFTTLAHAGRALLGPLSLASVDALLSAISPARRPLARLRVLDVGCGKGEILLRAMRRFDAQGIGVEPNPAFAAAALARVHELGLAPDLVLHERSLEHAPLEGAQFDVAICTGAAHAFGDVPDALRALARLVPRGGWALFGCGYWRRKPAREYLDAFGGSEDELRMLEDTLALPASHGWTVTAHHESTVQEWDDYESGYAGNIRDWLAANASDPEAEAFRGRIESWNAAYERWGRETMGFVTLVLKRRP
jgi:SAM-dependent methyltransferase